MTRTIIENSILRRRFIWLAAALVVAVAALGSVGMKAAAVDSDTPTVTVERINVLTSFPDDLDATFRLKLDNNDQVMSQLGWGGRKLGGSNNGTQVIHVRDFDNVMMAKITFEDGATIPWHTHPGPAVATVAQGSLTITNASDCIPRDYEAGKGFLDPGHGNIHMAKADGETIVYVTFFEVPDDGVATIPVDFQGCS